MKEIFQNAAAAELAPRGGAREVRIEERRPIAMPGWICDRIWAAEGLGRDTRDKIAQLKDFVRCCLTSQLWERIQEGSRKGDIDRIDDWLGQVVLRTQEKLDEARAALDRVREKMMLARTRPSRPGTGRAAQARMKAGMRMEERIAKDKVRVGERNRDGAARDKAAYRISGLAHMIKPDDEKHHEPFKWFSDLTGRASARIDDHPWPAGPTLFPDDGVIFRADVKEYRSMRVRTWLDGPDFWICFHQAATGANMKDALTAAMKDYGINAGPVRVIWRGGTEILDEHVMTDTRRDEGVIDLMRIFEKDIVTVKTCGGNKMKDTHGTKALARVQEEENSLYVVYCGGEMTKEEVVNAACEAAGEVGGACLFDDAGNGPLGQKEAKDGRWPFVRVTTLPKALSPMSISPPAPCRSEPQGEGSANSPTFLGSVGPVRNDSTIQIKTQFNSDTVKHLKCANEALFIEIAMLLHREGPLGDVVPCELTDGVDYLVEDKNGEEGSLLQALPFEQLNRYTQGTKTMNIYIKEKVVRRHLFGDHPESDEVGPGCDRSGEEMDGTGNKGGARGGTKRGPPTPGSVTGADTKQQRAGDRSEEDDENEDEEEEGEMITDKEAIEKGLTKYECCNPNCRNNRGKSAYKGWYDTKQCECTQIHCAAEHHVWTGPGCLHFGCRICMISVVGGGLADMGDQVRPRRLCFHCYDLRVDVILDLADENLAELAGGAGTRIRQHAIAKYERDAKAANEVGSHGGQRGDEVVDMIEKEKERVIFLTVRGRYGTCRLALTPGTTTGRLHELVAEEVQENAVRMRLSRNGIIVHPDHQRTIGDEDFGQNESLMYMSEHEPRTVDPFWLIERAVESCERNGGCEESCGCWAHGLYSELPRLERLTKGELTIAVVGHMQADLDDMKQKSYEANERCESRQFRSKRARCHRQVFDEKILNGAKGRVVSGEWEFSHYGLDRVPDKGWGCTYRIWQQITSWARGNGLTTNNIPSIEEIQLALRMSSPRRGSIKIGESERIGVGELKALMHEGNWGIRGFATLTKTPNGPMEHAETIIEHFEAGGGPVAIGAGDSSFCVMGWKWKEAGRLGETEFLIADPHFIEGENIDERGEVWADLPSRCTGNGWTTILYTMKGTDHHHRPSSIPIFWPTQGAARYNPLGGKGLASPGEALPRSSDTHPPQVKTIANLFGAAAKKGLSQRRGVATPGGALAQQQVAGLLAGEDAGEEGEEKQKGSGNNRAFDLTAGTGAEEVANGKARQAADKRTISPTGIDPEFVNWLATTFSNDLGVALTKGKVEGTRMANEAKAQAFLDGKRPMSFAVDFDRYWRPLVVNPNWDSQKMITKELQALKEEKAEVHAVIITALPEVKLPVDTYANCVDDFMSELGEERKDAEGIWVGRTTIRAAINMTHKTRKGGYHTGARVFQATFASAQPESSPYKNVPSIIEYGEVVDMPEMGQSGSMRIFLDMPESDSRALKEALPEWKALGSVRHKFDRARTGGKNDERILWILLIQKYPPLVDAIMGWAYPRKRVLVGFPDTFSQAPLLRVVCTVDALECLANKLGSLKDVISVAPRNHLMRKPEHIELIVAATSVINHEAVGERAWSVQEIQDVETGEKWGVPGWRPGPNLRKHLAVDGDGDVVKIEMDGGDPTWDASEIRDLANKLSKKGTFEDWVFPMISKGRDSDEMRETRFLMMPRKQAMLFTKLFKSVNVRWGHGSQQTLISFRMHSEEDAKQKEGGGQVIDVSEDTLAGLITDGDVVEEATEPGAGLVGLEFLGFVFEEEEEEDGEEEHQGGDNFYEDATGDGVGAKNGMEEQGVEEGDRKLGDWQKRDSWEDGEAKEEEEAAPAEMAISPGGPAVDDAAGTDPAAEKVETSTDGKQDGGHNHKGKPAHAQHQPSKQKQQHHQQTQQQQQHQEWKQQQQQRQEWKQGGGGGGHKGKGKGNGHKAASNGKTAIGAG